MQGEWEPLWVTDFPMFDDDDGQRWNAVHHPFTSPKDGHEDWLESDPGRCIAKAYDVVLNGIELGGGSVRSTSARTCRAVFRALNIGAEEAQAKFGFLLDALKYGAPPARRHRDRPGPLRHADDRRREPARRDRLPKTQRAQCLLTHAPSRSTTSSCASCTSA